MKKTLFITLLVGAFSYGQVFAEDMPSPPGTIIPGTLVVEGYPGYGQGDEYSVYQCSRSRGSSGGSVSVVKGSCKHIGTAAIGQHLSLRTGVYQLDYSVSKMFVEIKAHEVTEVHLRTIKIDPTANSHEIYWDLTDESMQDAFLIHQWAHNGSFWDNRICSDFISEELPLEVRMACRSYNSDNFEEYSELFKFYEDGTWANSTYNPSTEFESVWWRKEKRYGGTVVLPFIDSASVQDYVSVFPGVYINVFKKGSQKVVKYGVKAFSSAR